MFGMYKNKVFGYLFLGLALSLPLDSYAGLFEDLIKIDGRSRFEQGALVHGRLVKLGMLMSVEGRALTLGPKGEFVFGIGRDHGQELNIALTEPEGQVYRYEIPIKARTYDIQRINGIAKKYMSPNEQALKRIRADATLVRQTRTNNLKRLNYLSDFSWPVVGRITGVYGSQRIFNGEPRRPHYGIDIAAPQGTPVLAPAPGQITMVHPDMYYSGGTVILDHGYGVSSTFLHLYEIKVSEGDLLRQGDVIGTVGSSGRSTGAHLDWRVNWFDQRLDPSVLAGPMPE